MFSQSWSNNTEQPVLFYDPQWHHHWWLVYLILCKLRDLPCYSTIKTSQQTDRGVDGTVRFTINHVSCSCAAAVGSWIMWVSLDLSESHHFFFCRTTTWWFMTKHSSFNRCEVWTVDAASLCDCAARSTSDHQLPGLLFSHQLLDSIGSDSLQEKDWSGLEWRILDRAHTIKIH